MRVIEHFRHSMRHRPGKHLTQQGVELARAVGQTLDRFDRVVTSDLPRAYETAIAMGYAVDDQRKKLGSLFKADGEIDWTVGCAGFAEAARRGGKTARAASRHADVLREIAASLPEYGRALVVSHGGVLELGTVGLLPDYDFSAWGPSCSYCEGIKLIFEGDRCVGGAIVRLPDELAARYGLPRAIDRAPAAGP